MSKPTKADRDGADGPAGNRIEVDGFGEFYRIDGVKAVAVRPAAGHSGRRIALLIESPALAAPAAAVLNYDQVDALVRLVLTAREAICSAEDACECPKCQNRRAEAEDGPLRRLFP